MAYVDESGVTTLTNEIKNYIQTYFLDLHYPVGSIYLSINSTSPATLFGGTWEQIQDRFLLAAGETYNAGDIGGEAEHTLTIDEMPSHNHKQNVTANSGGTGVRQDWDKDQTGLNQYDQGIYTANAGGDQAHNNMPPYLTVYMWKRVS